MKNKRWNPRRLFANLFGTVLLVLCPASLVYFVIECAKGAYNIFA
jgi:hypothetical protein